MAASRGGGERALSLCARLGGVGAFTVDNFPVFDHVRPNVYAVFDSNHGYKMRARSASTGSPPATSIRSRIRRIPVLIASGGCLCGAILFRVDEPLRDVVFCHCSLCRRTHGHIAAYTACAATTSSCSEREV